MTQKRESRRKVVVVYVKRKQIKFITQSDRSKIVLNCNYDLIGYIFFRSIRSDLELNRTIIWVLQKHVLYGWLKMYCMVDFFTCMPYIHF